MTRVEITRVDRHDTGAVRCGLDEPTVGARCHGWTIKLVGWTEPGALRSVTVVTDTGATLAQTAPAFPRPDVADVPEAVGYFLALNTLDFERDFTFQVRGERDDGSVMDLATVTGHRTPLTPAPDTRFSPVILNCLGRVGSTWVSSVFDRHPELIAYRAFEFEVRSSIYWMEMFRAMSAPRSYFQTFAANLSNPSWWTGDADPAPVLSLPDDTLLDWMGGDAVEQLAHHCTRQTDGFYARAAEVESKPHARYFVEKTGHAFITRALRELYPGARELFQVRDFRDMYTSMRAHFNRPPHTPVGDDELIERVKVELDAYVAQWEARRDTARVLRYESLVQEPEATLAGILEWMGVDASPSRVEVMITEASATRPDLQAEHRTTPNPAASIGRWRRDLPRDLADRCDRELRRFNDAFGYEA